MEQRSAREIQAELAKPFAPEDLEWRLQQAFEDKMRGIAVPFVTNRAIQTRLDEVVGPNNWYNDYKPWHRFTVKVRDRGDYKEKEVISQLCGIAIYFADRKEWICKWDGAEDTDLEPVKGGLSDSMKRAAVQWGIGRVLYSMDTVFVDIEKKGRSFIIKPSERAKLDQAYLNMLESLGLKPASAGGLQSLLAPRKISAPPEEGEGQPPSPVQQQPEDPMAAKSEVPAHPEAQSAQEAETPADDTQQLGQPGPVPWEYMVCFAKVQKGMNAQNTQLVLMQPDGKKVSAFARGVHPELQAGARLTGARLNVLKQDTVVFNVLEDYCVVEQPQAA